METIKIVVFALGLFFGIETTSVVAKKTTVTVDPTEKTIIIQQENLLAIYPKTENSTTVEKQFSEIYTKKEQWNTLFDSYPEKSIVYSSPKKGVLNATITLKYNTTKDLKAYAIDVNRENKFSIINIPQWKLETTDGELNGNYWNFDADKPFSFSYHPVEEVPEKYTVDHELIFNVWEKISK
ncbi:hypothetical protein [Kordia sp.]|uniref:hypothetical protein n=1 Tax=Kordia sp. TaxID=1965332 RepID=UPI003B5AFD5B